MVGRRFLFCILFPIVLLTVGTFGYCEIEGWDAFDSLYMTIITVTTVGFAEVHPLSNSGRVFTMILSLGGIFTLFYATTETIRTIISGEVQGLWEKRKMEQRLRVLRDHLIVCGFGRMGKLVCDDFAAKAQAFVVIERDPVDTVDLPGPHGVLIQGDATSDHILQRAGIERARAVVSVVNSDADNLYITMSARLLNDRLLIVTRAEEANSEAKMRRAGANHVVLPFVIGGSRVAQAVLRPTVVDFIELASSSTHFALQLEEQKIDANSVLAGKTISESRVRQEFEVIIVAVKRVDGSMIFNPPSDVSIEAGDILIAIGDRKHLERLAEAAGGGRGKGGWSSPLGQSGGKSPVEIE